MEEPAEQPTQKQSSISETALSMDEPGQESTDEHAENAAADNIELIFEQELDENCISNQLDEPLETLLSFGTVEIPGINTSKVYERVRLTVQDTCENIPESKKITK